MLLAVASGFEKPGERLYRVRSGVTDYPVTRQLYMLLFSRKETVQIFSSGLFQAIEKLPGPKPAGIYPHAGYMP